MALALALDLISEYHGQVVSLVAQTLSSHGALTLAELQKKVREKGRSSIATVTDIDFFHDRSDLTKTPPLSPESIQSAVVVLIRYSIVHMRVKTSSENRLGNKFVSHRCQYYLSERHALMMLRIPRMIEHVKQKLGPKEAFLVEELLVRGAETKTELIEGLAMRVALRNDDAMYEALKDDFEDHHETAQADYTEEPLPSESASDDSLLQSVWAIAAKDIFLDVFSRLVTRDVLIPFQPFAVKTTVDTNASAAATSSATASKKRKRKESSEKAGTSGEAATSTAPRPLPKGPEAKGSSLTQSLELRVMLERAKLAKPAGRSKKKKKRGKSKVKIENEKKSALDEEDAALFHGSSGVTAQNEFGQETWWRVNPNYFLQAFRIQMINRFVVEKSGEEQMGVFPETFYKISYSKRASKGSKHVSDFDLPERSKSVSRTVLLRQLMPTFSKSYAGQEEAVFDVYTKLLAQDPSNIVTYEEDGNGGLLTFNFAEIARGLKWRCILRMIEQQHDKKGARIIRLLEARGALEEKQIGDLVMMPRKEARSKLYSLLRSGLVVWEEAPRRTDYLPSQVYHLWSTNKEKIMAEFMENCYKAMLNMRIRYRALSQYNKELDRFVQYEEEVASGQMSQEEMLKVPGVEKYHRYRLAFDKLDRAMLDLDLTCMLLDLF